MQRNKKNVVFFMLLGAGMIIYGCAMSEEITYLQERVSALEARSRQVETKSDQLYAKIDEFSENRVVEDRELRNQNAGLRVLADQLREENRILNGKVEEIEFLVKGRDQTGKGLSASLDDLNRQLVKNTQRLVRLEQYMGFEPSEKMAASPVSGTTEKAKSPDHDLYVLAKRSLDQGDLGTARTLFTRLLERYPESANADNARFWIGESYYQEKWYDKAILEYQDVIEKYPGGNKVAASYLKQGFAFAKIGDKTNARLVLKELIRKFPKSKEAKIATERIRTLR